MTAGESGGATRIELHNSKQLLPASAWPKRQQPGLNSRWITTRSSWDRFQIVTLDGRASQRVAGGGAASNGGGSGGRAAPPSKPNPASKMSPVRARTRWAGTNTWRQEPPTVFNVSHQAEESKYSVCHCSSVDWSSLWIV